MLALKANDKIALTSNIALYGDDKKGLFLLFNVITGEQFSLNFTSFWVSKLILEEMKWSKLKDSFFQKFKVSKSRGSKDLEDLINQLLKLGLIEIERG